MLFLAGAFIFCGDINDTVCIDIKGNFNLRYSSGSGCNTVKNKSAEGGVISSHLTLALKNMDFNGGLTVSGSGVNLTLLDRNCGVSVDYLIEHAAESFNTERKGSYVEQQKVFHIAAENAALNCGTDCDAFIGVDTFEGLFAKEVLDSVLNSRDTR